jgi:hypothetical protein
MNIINNNKYEFILSSKNHIAQFAAGRGLFRYQYWRIGYWHGCGYFDICVDLS